MWLVDVTLKKEKKKRWCPIETEQAKSQHTLLLLMHLIALWKNIMQAVRQRGPERDREKKKRDLERVNVCPLMVKPCMLSDWLTGSAGAMLESNWVRVCELEERSLNVSHCCRRQTDSEKKHVSQSASAVTSHIYIISLSLCRDATPTQHHQQAWKQNGHCRLSYTVSRSERGGAELSENMFDDE